MIKKKKKDLSLFSVKGRILDLELKSSSPEGLDNVNLETLFIQSFQVGSILDMN